MARPEAREADKVIETWESAVAGSVWVWVYDRREDRYIKASCGGRTGSRRLHISRDDRKYNQEQIPVENSQHDPFTNGALRFIDAATRDDSLDMRYHFTDLDLGQIFDVRDMALFEEAVKEIESELILRRLAALGEQIGTMAQVDVVRELLQERYPIGGTQKTVREMIEAGERLGITRR
jgi:hypothetical protein